MSSIVGLGVYLMYVQKDEYNSQVHILVKGDTMFGRKKKEVKWSYKTGVDVY